MTETWKPEPGETDMVVLQGSPTAEEQAAIHAVLTELGTDWAQTKHRKVLDAPTGWIAGTRPGDGSIASTSSGI